MSTLKILVIGGVAGGASAAARARRCNADAEITLLEKGPSISFANCGLPYQLGGEIKSRDQLLVATPELFWDRFRVQVKTRCEALKIDRQRRLVTCKDLESGETFDLPYDRLILSMGAEPLRPPFWTAGLTNVYSLWTLTDLDGLQAHLQTGNVRRVAVIGGGFVGLESVEQLHHRGVEVALIERNPQVLTPLDPEMAVPVEGALRAAGIKLFLGATVQRFITEGQTVTGIEFADGTHLDCQLVLMGVGVRPRTQLARDAGLTIGPAGGVAVNNLLQTSDPQIYACGDLVEYTHQVLDEPMRIPLGGPANRSGRIAGAHAACGDSLSMGAVLGTAIVRVFDETAACTGLNEKACRARGIEYRTAFVQATHHASYFPGALPMTLKLLYAPADGKVLGAQVVGKEGVDKRIDVIASVIHFGGTVHDLAQLDLAYAPPYGSAKDPIHMLGFTAENDLRSAPELAPPGIAMDGWQVVDVRTTAELESLPVPGAVHIPIDELAARWRELDPQRPTLTICQTAKRGHVAACWLRNQGFPIVKNITGGASIRKLLARATV
jgi:NADPH-dependent 2,4-dienoyl-CoA reductase/sulfur reductase-like enzyme/rhodanese-related sulfurtransferase